MKKYNGTGEYAALAGVAAKVAAHSWGGGGGEGGERKDEAAVTVSRSL